VDDGAASDRAIVIAEPARPRIGLRP